MEDRGSKIEDRESKIEEGSRSSILNALFSFYGGGAVGETEGGVRAGSEAASGFGVGLEPGPRNCSTAALICSGLGVPLPEGLVICVSTPAQVISFGGFREPTGRTAIPCSLKVRASRSPPISISRVMGRVNFCTAIAP